MAHVIEGPQIVATDASLLAFTLVLVVLRLYIRIPQLGKITWSEAFIIVAWLSFAGQVVFDIINYKATGFDYNSTVKQTDEQLMITLKVLWAQNVAYYTCMYSIKLAMLCFLNEIIPRTSHWKSFVALRALFVLVVTGWIVTELAFIFKCEPISNAWSLDSEKNFCNTFEHNPSMNAGILAFHIGTDVMIYLLPLCILGALRVLPRRQKIGAGIMFAMGSLTIIFGIFFYLAASFWLEVGYGWIFAASEQATAITVACCPAFKVWLQRTVQPSVQRALRKPISMSPRTSTVMIMGGERPFSEISRGHRRLNSELV